MVVDAVEEVEQNAVKGVVAAEVKAQVLTVPKNDCPFLQCQARLGGVAQPWRFTIRFIRQI